MQLLFYGGIGLFVTFVIAAIIRSGIQLRNLKKQNYEWYVKTHPKHIHRGRPQCHSCNGSALNVERLMNQTYLRRHYCRNCGTTLYYSPEA